MIFVAVLPSNERSGSMASYAILRFSKCKAGGVAATDRHNERKKSAYKSNPDIDMDRIKENFHIVQPHGTYKATYEKLIVDAGCKQRKDSVVMVETLLTGTHEFLMKMSRDEVRQYYQHAYDFMVDKVGKQNIISAVVHMDETTPHMHLSFCPITADNRLAAKDILGNRAKLSKWQDEYHAYMVKQYPELQRGISSLISHRKHIPVCLFKQADRLETVYGEINQALSDISMFNAGKKRDEALATLSKWIPDMTKFTAQIHTVDKYIEELKQGQSNWAKELERRNDNLQVKVDSKENDLLKANQEIYRMGEIQRKYERLLNKVPKDVMEKLIDNNSKSKGAR
jgi:hypothetical protein